LSGSNEDEEKLHVPLNINERRTRRGVYHIAQDDSDDSDDSEAQDSVKETKEVKNIAKQEEKDLSSELSSLLSPSTTSSDVSPARAGSSRLGPSRVGMMTPDTDTGAFSPPQALSAAIGADGKSRKSTPATPYKSIIATRRQKAAASAESISTTTTPIVSKTIKIENQLVTPPPSVEAASIPDEPSAPIVEKRVTRSISSAILVDKGEAKATSSKRKAKGKDTDKDGDGDDETEEPEVTRVLRSRPSAHASQSIAGSPVKPEIPRDECGRPLPTCITCFNILPIIHVDREVVWGVGKKKEMLECPRFVCNLPEFVSVQVTKSFMADACGTLQFIVIRGPHALPAREHVLCQLHVRNSLRSTLHPAGSLPKFYPHLIENWQPLLRAPRSYGVAKAHLMSHRPKNAKPRQLPRSQCRPRPRKR